MGMVKQVIGMFVLGISALQATERTMIMLFDEYGEKGDIAVKEYLLQALYEQKTPILTSSLLLKNTLSTLPKIDRFLAACDKDEDPLCMTLNEINELIHKKNISPGDLKGFLAGLNINLPDMAERPSFKQDFFAVTVKLNNFNPEAWKIYSIDDQFLLLIPTHLINLVKADYTLKGLSLDEKLGISISTLPEIAPLDILNNTFSAQPTSALKNPLVLQTILKKVFIQKQSASSFQPDWYFMLVGHGTPPNPNNTVLLSQFYIVKKLIEQETNPKKIAGYTIKLLALSKEINAKGNATISGMNVTSFTTMLNFFNNQLSTKFLYYISCFSGGINMELSYVNDQLEHDIYNYTIISQSITNQPTSNKTWASGKKITTIANNGNSITLNTQLSFQSFFDNLIHNKPFLDVFKHITNTLINPMRVELPTIRYKNTPLFIPLDINLGDTPSITQVINLTTTRFKQLLAEGKSINLYAKEILFINQNYIPMPITIFDKNTAIIAKSNYVPVVFETINAPKLSLADLVTVFNKKIDQPMLIKNLTINMGSKVALLTNVVIDLQTTSFTGFRDLLSTDLPLFVAFTEQGEVKFLEFDQEQQLLIDNENIYRGKMPSNYTKLFSDIYSAAKMVEDVDISTHQTLQKYLQKRRSAADVQPSAADLD